MMDLDHYKRAVSRAPNLPDRISVSVDDMPDPDLFSARRSGRDRTEIEAPESKFEARL